MGVDVACRGNEKLMEPISSRSQRMNNKSWKHGNPHCHCMHRAAPSTYSCRHFPCSPGYYVFLVLISLLFPFLSLVSLYNNFVFHYSGTCENCVSYKCSADVIVVFVVVVENTV